MSRKKLEIKNDGYSMNGLDALLHTDEQDSDTKPVEVSLSELVTFENHPFKVKDDAGMEVLVDSIKQNGIITPLLVRPNKNGTYEIIAGHRRRRAAELCGMTEVPAYIMECDDDTAIIVMVDSNIQREEILPSERAFSYKMKMEAKKRQGKRTDLNGDKPAINSAEEIGMQNGELSARTVYRYISLTRLLPELLDMVDNKVLSLNTGFNIAALADALPEIQQWFLDFYHEEELIPDAKLCSVIHSHIKEGRNLTKEFVRGLFGGIEKPVKLTLFSNSQKSEKIRSYFEEDTSQDDMEEIIISLLEEWKHSR